MKRNRFIGGKTGFPADSCRSRIRWRLGLTIASLAAVASLNAQEHGGTRAGLNVSPTVESSSASALNVTWFQHLASELRKLRLEILEYRWEAHETKLAELQRELQQVLTEQRSIEEERRLENEQLNELNAHLTQSELTKEEREELQARRTALASGGSVKLQASHAATMQLEAQARERLRRHQERMQVLLHRAQELTAVASEARRPAAVTQPPRNK